MSVRQILKFFWQRISMWDRNYKTRTHTHNLSMSSIRNRNSNVLSAHNCAATVVGMYVYNWTTSLKVKTTRETKYVLNATGI
jgi:hypothetical protein